MARRNISLPADVDQRARAAGLNVSALAREAILAELERRARMSELDAWLDELDEEHGPPSTRATREAQRWVAAVAHQPTTTAGAPRRTSTSTTTGSRDQRPPKRQRTAR